MKLSLRGFPVLLSLKGLGHIEESIPMSIRNIEVGYGAADGTDSFAVGLEAAQHAMAGIMEHSPSVVLVFASIQYDLEEVLKAIRYAIHDAPVLGATTAGEICNGPRRRSVVVVVLASPYLKVSVGIGGDVSSDWEEAAMQAVSSSEIKPYFFSESATTRRKLAIEGKQAFGLLLSPGNTRYADSRSFEILEKLKHLSEGGLPLFGGASADDWRMDRNAVLHGDRVCPDSLLIAVFETSLQFGMALNHGFVPGLDRSTVTRVEGHTVLEMDGLPAADVYARLAGKSVEELGNKHLTLTTGRPVGVSDPYGQYSIITASYLTPDHGIRLSQPVPRGAILTLMEPRPESLVGAGREAVRKALLRGNIDNPVMVIAFSCALRHKLLGDRIGEEVSGIEEVAPGVPVVGFYSFGEQGLADDGVNRHNNGVISTLVLGEGLSYAARVAAENSFLRRQLEQALSCLRKREESLRQSEERFRVLVEQAPEAIVVYDGDLDCFVDANKNAERLFGLDREELLKSSRSCFQCSSDGKPMAESLRMELKQALAGDVVVFEREVHNPEGRKLPCEVRLVRLPSRDRRLVRASFIDITDRKRAEQALQESSRKLKLFAYSVAHDLKSPAIGIHGLTRRLSEYAGDVLDERGKKYCEQILKASEHIAALVEKINVYIATKETKLSLERIHLVDSIAMLKDEFSPQLSRRRIQWIEPAAGIEIKADRLCILRVLRNLIDNALKYGGEDLSRIEIGYEETQDLHILSISDNGRGMRKEDSDKVFDLFQRNETSRGIEGAGLGLTIVKEIAEQHGGRAWIEQRSTQGITFCLSISKHL